MTIRIENFQLSAREYYSDHNWLEGQEIRLQDGKLIRLIPGTRTLIPAVHGRKGFRSDLRFIKDKTLLSDITFKILTETLIYFSIDYARNIHRTVTSAFMDKHFIIYHPITLHQIEKWSHHTSLSYWPFLKFYLYQLSQTNDERMVDEEVRAFILDPEIQELNDNGDGPYFALLTNDPDRGALTEQELKSIQNGVNKAYIGGAISFREYAITWFQVGTGVRPIQTVRMRNKHVQIEDGPAGIAREVTLLIPLAKNRGGKSSGHIRRRAPSVLADILIRYQNSKGSPDPDDSLFDFDVSDDLNILLNYVFSKIETYSDRTKGPIHITPYRFRYTLATRAIAQGATDAQVARLLTHKNTNSIKHYRASLASLQMPINEAIGEEMDFFAGVFSGGIINDFDEATNSGNYNRLIRDFERMTGKKIGACGAKTDCYLDAPRACLTCFLFEPFIDADWDYLENEIRVDLNGETEPKIKQIHLDQFNAVQAIKNACIAKLKLHEESPM
ncbi:site-specific integrase [Nisaea sp.]|uniref:site-specific integrase n=1 Tax=Nisaea sp. TaxID=2024842 RepID=UPI002B2742A0|nr:site-specific integrase [Nisaea sp.]